MTSLEDRIRSYSAVLDEAAQVQAGASSPRPLAFSATPSWARPVRVLVAIAAAGVLVLASAWLVHQRTATSMTDLTDASVVTTAVSTVPPTSNPVEVGTVPPGADSDWFEVAPSPLSAREDASVVWTGKEFLVWGGHQGNLALSDGAAYDPETNTWRAVANNAWAHPGARATWTGSSMVVVAKNGGAVYDPATDTWNDLPRIDDPRAGAFAAAFWNGTQVVGVGAGRDEAGKEVVAAAAIAPGASTWEVLPQSPMEWSESLQYVATPGGFTVWDGGAASRGFSFDFATTTWTAVPPLSTADMTPVSSTLVSVDGRLAAIVTLSGIEHDETRLATLDDLAWQLGPPGLQRTTSAVGVPGAIMAFGNNGVPWRELIRASDGAQLGTWPDVTIGVTGTSIAVGGNTVFVWAGRDRTGALVGTGQLWRSHP